MYIAGTVAFAVFIAALFQQDLNLQWAMIAVGAGLWGIVFSVYSAIQVNNRLKRIECKIGSLQSRSEDKPRSPILSAVNAFLVILDHIISEKRKEG